MDDSVLFPEIMSGRGSNILYIPIDQMEDGIPEEFWSSIDNSSHAHLDSSGKSIDELNTNQSGSCSQEDRQEALINEAQRKDFSNTPSLPQRRIGSSSIERNLRGSEEDYDEEISQSIVLDRVSKALAYLQKVITDREGLIQVWVPVNRERRLVLVTPELSYARLGPRCPRLYCYRDISVKYYFPIDKDPDGILGLPGRVFLGKVPEWTPDVRFYRIQEHPLLLHAQQYDVRGTLAVPLFGRRRICLGVIEFVMTNSILLFRPEMERICKALEACDLNSSTHFFSGQKSVALNTYDEEASSEILEVFKDACQTHGLPLAQAWVPCIQQGRDHLYCSNECVSRMDRIVYAENTMMLYFNDACSEHHLLKGQDVVGKAFMTNQPCFLADITSFCKTDYPLSHYARMFGLRAAMAIRLRSTLISKADYVLEFFLPLDCTDEEDQKRIVNSLSSLTIQRSYKTLRVVKDNEPEEESEYIAFQNLQPFDTVEQSGANGLSFSKEKNSREAFDGKLLWPESGVDQNEICSDLTLSMDSAEVPDAIRQGSCLSLLVNETSKEWQATGERTVNVPVSNDATKSTRGKNTGNAGKKRDAAWEYCSRVKKGKSSGLRCSFCGKVIMGGANITRFKSHLCKSDPSKNVRKCDKVPPKFRPR